MVPIGQFWQSLTEAQTENTWTKPPGDITLIQIRLATTECWGGHSELPWGWCNQWQKRFLIIAQENDTATDQPKNGAPSWLFHFADESPDARLKGCVCIGAHYSNVKLMPRNNRLCSVFVPSPPDSGDAARNELTFRSVEEDADEKELRHFSSVTVVLCREENSLSRQFMRAFDRETYLDDAVDALPTDLVNYALNYIRSQPTPNGEVGSNMLEWLHSRLIAIVDCDKLDKVELCRAAKNVTAFLGLMTEDLFCRPDRPEGVEPRGVWMYICILQQYQVNASADPPSEPPPIEPSTTQAVR